MRIINRFGLSCNSDVFYRRVKKSKKNEQGRFHPSILSRLHGWRLERHLKQEGKSISAIRVKSNAIDRRHQTQRRMRVSEGFSNPYIIRKQNITSSGMTSSYSISPVSMYIGNLLDVFRMRPRRNHHRSIILQILFSNLNRRKSKGPTNFARHAFDLEQISLLRRRDKRIMNIGRNSNFLCARRGNCHPTSPVCQAGCDGAVQGALGV